MASSSPKTATQIRELVKRRAILVSLLLSVILFGCENSGFSGTWIQKQGDFVYVLKNDGTCVFAVKSAMPDPQEKPSCKWWKVSDNQILIDLEINFALLDGGPVKANILSNGNMFVRWPNNEIANLPNQEFIRR